MTSIGRWFAILVTPPIAEEIVLVGAGTAADVRLGRIGDDEVDVLVGEVEDAVQRPMAILVTDWMREHLYLYSRELWHRAR